MRLFFSTGIIENIAEYRPEVSHDLANQGLLRWLMQRVKQKTFDSNKLYATEVLAILLQENDNTRSLLGDLEGIDTLLQQLNVTIHTSCNSISKDTAYWIYFALKNICKNTRKIFAPLHYHYNHYITIEMFAIVFFVISNVCKKF